MTSHAMQFFNALISLPENVEKIMTTVTELAVTLTTIGDQLLKAKTEILQKISDLEAAVANTVLPPAAEDALAALKASAQSLDDIVPDVTV